MTMVSPIENAIRRIVRDEMAVIKHELAKEMKAIIKEECKEFSTKDTPRAGLRWDEKEEERLMNAVRLFVKGAAAVIGRSEVSIWIRLQSMLKEQSWYSDMERG